MQTLTATKTKVDQRIAITISRDLKNPDMFCLRSEEFKDTGQEMDRFASKKMEKNDTNVRIAGYQASNKLSSCAQIIFIGSFDYSDEYGSYKVFVYEAIQVQNEDTDQKDPCKKRSVEDILESFQVTNLTKKALEFFLEN